MSDRDQAIAFKRILRSLIGRHKVVVFKGHMERGRPWYGGEGHPRAIMVHHTAGAATSSKNPHNPGNQTGANAGVVQWCLHPSSQYPYCNLTIDRDGTVYVNSLLSVWHSGEGSVDGTHWERLALPDDNAHLGTLGIEVVSKGQRRDFTRAQKASLDAVAVAARQAYGWRGFRYRIMNHKDWAPDRKTDSLYPWSYWVDRARLEWAKHF